MPTAAGTAWQTLIETAQLRSGQTVLIHGGAGGVGGFAVQFAKNAGARVISPASKENFAFVQVLGADTVIDYQSQNFATEVSDVDVVLDTVSGETQEKSFDVLRKGGHLLSIVSPPDGEKAKALGITATFVAHKTDAIRLALLVDLFATRKVNVEVAATYPLGEARSVLTKIASGRGRGRLLATTLQ